MPPKVHPGEIIKMEIMEPLGMDLETAAGLFGVQPELLAGVISGQCAVNQELAVGLARQGHGTERMWLALQKAVGVWP
ncbi:HigA family addiction module antitoxin [Bordetella trematum]|uniref:HigA family addiction module antitoxin n=1 Tax=Bordetella trematum TaxID=123899 RepID=UPI0039899E7D